MKKLHKPYLSVTHDTGNLAGKLLDFCQAISGLKFEFEKFYQELLWILEVSYLILPDFSSAG